MDTSVRFVVKGLEATIPEGIPVEIHGRRFESGPVHVRLDDAPAAGESGGLLDYLRNGAVARFMVRFDLPVLEDLLRSAGIEEAFEPMRGRILSSGAVLPDHSLALSGTCRFSPHDLFRGESLEAEVLPGT